MDATLNILVKLLAFSDTQVNSNPRLRAVDWDREASGIAVSDPVTTGHEIAVGSSKVIFNGVRSTTLDGTSAFSLALLNIDTASSYRATWTGGTNPSLRTGRALTLNSCVVTFSVQANNVVNLSVPAMTPSDFTPVVVGDYIFVPGTTTGDAANVFNEMNVGYWQVIAKTDNQNLVITRPFGTAFEGVTETQTLTSNAQMVAYGSAGVQIGDTMVLSSGFATASLKSFVITAVTDKFVEFTSTLPLPNQTGILPTATGMVFYTDNKRIVYIEADQEAVVQINGDTGEFQKLSPIEPGNPLKPAIFLKSGSVFSLTVVNKSTSTLNVLVVSAE